MLLYIASLVLLSIDAPKGAAACGSTYMDEYGTISSPGYPGPFPKNSHCTWTVQHEKGNWIQLNFTALDINAGVGCYDGSVSVLNLHGGTIGFYCGQNRPAAPLATNNGAEVKFEVLETTTGTGFSLNYRSYPCGGDLTDRTGEIRSPNYPYNYPNGMECTWNIERPANERVKIEFSDFIVDYHENCDQDSVKLIDVIDGKEHVSGVYCGNMTASTAFSTSNKFLVRFKTNDWTAKRGFLLTYTAIQDSEVPVPEVPIADCKVTLDAPSGIIRSPNYPNDSPINERCTWTIQRPEGDWIELEFLELDLESTRDCVRVSSETGYGSRGLGTYCKNNKPCEPLSTNNNAVITLTTKTTKPKRGFVLRYTSNSCKLELTEASGEIHSPNYPNKYPRGVECSWTIKASAEKRIKVDFLDLDVVYGEGCEYNSVRLFNKFGDEEQPAGVFCGNVKPTATYSTGNEMVVKFKTSGTAPRRGFSLRYATVDSA